MDNSSKTNPFAGQRIKVIADTPLDMTDLQADGAQDTEKLQRDRVREHFEEWGVHMCDSAHLGAEAAGAPSLSDSELREALVRAFHQTRTSNESPEYDMDVARARIDAMLSYPHVRAALTATSASSERSDPDPLDEQELVDIIEQAIFETDTGLAAALLASERILARATALDEVNELLDGLEEDTE